MLRENVSLTPFLSMALPSRARWLAEVSSVEQLAEAAQWARAHRHAPLLLGSGTNTVLQNDCAGLVIRMALPGVAVTQLSEDEVQLQVSAGEDWPQLVRRCQRQGWSGLENLAMIPGSAGAAPVRNIGAYGAELSQVLQRVEVFDLAGGAGGQLSAKDCRLGYRSSLFLAPQSGRLAITAVHLRLKKSPSAVAARQLTHPQVRQRLREAGCRLDAVSSEQLYRTVCALRTEKLPDPAQLPNVGSFFTNPLISPPHCEQLRAELPDMPYRCESDGCRVSAAWLISQAGWKGRRRGSVGVWERHALILTNYGGGSGRQLVALAEEIRTDVAHRYGVELEYEPRIY